MALALLDKNELWNISNIVKLADNLKYMRREDD
jgi:hypothetical protein